MTFQTTRKTQWTLEELSALANEAEAAREAAMIAADIVTLAMKRMTRDQLREWARMARPYRQSLGLPCDDIDRLEAWLDAEADR